VSGPALSLDCESIGYPGAAPALEHVTLTLQPGERVAVLGGNGAGKTALLKTLVGLLPARGGRVKIAGVDVRGEPVRAVGAGAGLVFQNPDDQLFGATVWEDALFGPHNQGLAPDESARRVEQALAALGILALRDRPIDALSFGEKKRASLAGVLAMLPSLLLLDEPTAGLDPQGELAFIQLIERSSGPGRATLLLATHAVDLVPLFAERVILLAGRRIIADGPAREIFAQGELLRSASLRAPWAAELWLRLHEAAGEGAANADAARTAPLPLTLAEAAERFVRRQD
jgi:cobalt/nickel transport system ATP-binding protein